MKHKKLLKRTKFYLNDFTNKFCKGTKCSECKMIKGQCILDDLCKIVSKASDIYVK